MKRSTIIFGILTIVFDFCCTALSFLVAREIRTHTDLIPFVQLPIGYIPEPSVYIPFVLSASFFLLVIFALNGFYSFKIRYNVRQEFVRILFLSTTWILLVIAYFFIIHEYFFSRIVLLYSWLFAVIFIFLGRLLIRFIKRQLIRYGISVTHVLFIGNGAIMEELISRFHKDPFYHVIGLLSDHHRGSPLWKGTVDQLDIMVHQGDLDEVIQTSATQDETTSEDILEFCKANHIRYRFVPDVLEVQRTNVEITDDAGIPIIELKPTPLDGWGRVLKRAFDMVISLVGIIVLSPVFLLIALAIAIDSRGPIFFVQKRVGYHGKEFLCLKFRTMVKNAELLKGEILEKSERKGPLFKIKEDPRITRVGRFLRTWSLDELPQLFNVFLGTMSLVGPRPHLPSEVTQYKKHYHILFAIKPGVTGMAQVNGRSGLDFEDEVRFDVSYIQNWSIWLDIFILCKTVYVILRRENAD